MAEPKGSAVYPPTMTRTLRNPRTKEERTFEQEELTIDGEARLLGLVAWVGEALTNTDFPWEKLGALFSEDGQANFQIADAIPMLGKISAQIPEIATESTCIFFGLFPTDEKGARNPDYDEQKAFIRASMKFNLWVEIVETFTKQNDYMRLAAPFGRALTAGAGLSTRLAGRPMSPEEVIPNAN